MMVVEGKGVSSEVVTGTVTIREKKETKKSVFAVLCCVVLCCIINLPTALHHQKNRYHQSITTHPFLKMKNAAYSFFFSFFSFFKVICFIFTTYFNLISSLLIVLIADVANSQYKKLVFL